MLTVSVLNLRAESPFRPVDWRWSVAKLIRSDTRIASLLQGRHDEWTKKARKFQQAHEAARDDYDRLLLVRRWPSLLEAFNLKFEEDYSRRLLRYEVEARLLAAETEDRISERTRVSPAAVSWYEKLFFNVSDRLDSPGYISHVVIGEKLQSGLTDGDHDVLWKMFGYWGKSHVIDAVAYRSYDSTAPDNAGQTAQFFNDDAQKTAVMKTAIAMRSMPNNSYTREVIATIQQGYMQIKRMADGGGASADMIGANVQQMAAHIAWTIGDKEVLVSADDPKRIVGRLLPEVAAADRKGVELRADDLTRMNHGLGPRRVKALESAGFPEQKNANPVGG